MQARFRFSRHDLLLLLAALVLAWSAQFFLTTVPKIAQPAGWQVIPPQVPFRRASLSGPLRARPDVLNLDHFEGLRTSLEPALTTPLELRFRARIPPSGVVQASLTTPADLGKREPGTYKGGVAFTLDMGEPARSGISAVAIGPQQTPPLCRISDFEPGDGTTWIDFRLRIDQGFASAFADDKLIARCPTHLEQVGELALRSGLQRIHLDDVTLSASAGPVLEARFTHPYSGPLVFFVLFVLSVALLLGLRWLEVSLFLRAGMTSDGANLTFTLTQLPLFGLLLVDIDIRTLLAALRLEKNEPCVLIASVVLLVTFLVKLSVHLARPEPETGEAKPNVSGALDDVGFEPDEARPEPASTKHEAERQSEEPALSPPSSEDARALWPYLLCQLGASALLGDGSGWLWYVLTAGLLLPFAWSAFLQKYSTLTLRARTRFEIIIALEMGLLALGKLASLARSTSGLSSLLKGWGGAWMPLALGALALQLIIRLVLVNVNARAVRGTNGVSLILVAGLFVTAESAARYTYLDASLDDSESVRVLDEFKEVAVEGRFRKWPDKLFPVAFPPRDPQTRLRVVCMGGSSTAGAYQMKDMTLFYPFRLQLRLNLDSRLHPSDVLNQGVGGWNTLLMSLYLERMLKELKPDLVTFYIGHNDILTQTSVPYRVYWEQYHSGGEVGSGLRGWLNRSRLYVLFKQLLLARVQTASSAVPVSDARDNLRAVIALVKAHGGKVLLMSEGLNPSPEPLVPYFEMLDALAREDESTYYFDTATMLSRLPQEAIFLDDCHLTAYGHSVLADRIYRYLRANPELLDPGYHAQ